MTSKRTTKAAEAPAATQPERFILTSETAELAKEARLAPQEFALEATAPGAIARVRVVDLNSLDDILALPERFRRQIFEMQKEVERRNGNFTVKDDDGNIDIESGMEAIRLYKQAIDLYCLAGFVEPKLITSEHERTDTAQVLIELVHPADRQRFFEWCQSRNTGANATVAKFPKRPSQDVATRGSRRVSAPAKRSAQVA